MVARNIQAVGLLDELVTGRRQLKHAVLFDLLLQQILELGLTEHSLPEKVVTVGTGAELLQMVQVITLGVRILAAHEHIDDILGLERLLHGENSLKGQHHLLLRLNLGLGMHAIVAIAAIGLVIVLAEIAQDIEPATGRTLGIRHHLLHQLLGHLLLGDILVGEELI